MKWRGIRGCFFSFLLYAAAICQHQTIKDFIITDYENDQHNLYSYLSKNQHVLVEFTATN